MASIELQNSLRELAVGRYENVQLEALKERSVELDEGIVDSVEIPDNFLLLREKVKDGWFKREHFKCKLVHFLLKVRACAGESMGWLGEFEVLWSLRPVAGI